MRVLSQKITPLFIWCLRPRLVGLVLRSLSPFPSPQPVLIAATCSKGFPRPGRLRPHFEMILRQAAATGVRDDPA